MNRSWWMTDMLEVDALTAEQFERLNNAVATWLDCGRSAQPLDQTRAADAIRALYAAVDRPTPAVLFFSSPAMCILACQELCRTAWSRAVKDPPAVAQLAEQVRSHLRAQLDAQPIPKRWLPRRWRAGALTGMHMPQLNALSTCRDAWHRLSRHCEMRTDSRLAPSLRMALEAQLREAIWRQLRTRLWLPAAWHLEEWLERRARPQFGFLSRQGEPVGYVHEQEGQQLEITRHRATLDDAELSMRMPGTEALPSRHHGLAAGPARSCLGIWWSASAAFYEFCRNLGVRYAPEHERLLGRWLDQCRQTHWLFECDGIVFASHRPRALTVDAQGRLHNARGAALDYGDGFRLFAVHGVRIEEELVLHPQRLMVRRIESEHNVEVRRILIDLYGHARYLKDSGATLVHQHARGKLWRKQRADDADLVMVEVMNSTPEPDGSVRSYLLRVPPEMRTVSEAVAWTFGLQAREYHPCLET